MPLEAEPGKVVATGPADATASGETERADADAEAAAQARYVSAFSPDHIPGAQDSRASLEVSALMQQLEELDHAAQRSVATEVESAIEGGACLVDDAGRDRILEICKEIRTQAAKLSQPERMHRLGPACVSGRGAGRAK